MLFDHNVHPYMPKNVWAKISVAVPQICWAFARHPSHWKSSKDLEVIFYHIYTD
jgi:hypothetical protein